MNHNLRIIFYREVAMRYFATMTGHTRTSVTRVVGLFTIALLTLSLVVGPVVAGSVVTDDKDESSGVGYGSVPLHFQTNEGQASDGVLFLAKGNGYSLYLTANEAVLVLKKQNRDANVLRMQVVGGNEDPATEPQDRLAAKVNYLRGNDASTWVTGVSTYARAYYRGVYPGIDMVYYGTTERQLEYDFIVAPGADPSVVRVRFDGAESLRLTEDGSLIAAMSEGEVQIKAPVVYQHVDGNRVEVNSGYVLTGELEVGFVLEDYDLEHTLVIDPVVVYSTYLGGTGEDVVNDVFVDKHLQAHVVGYTLSGDFPTQDPVQFNSYFPGSTTDIFVSKFSADGQSLLFSTYLGGSDNDEGNGIAVDKDGHIYITGFTESSDFPTTVAALTPFDASYNGNKDIFVTKFDDDLDGLVYSTYIGSGNDDVANDIVLDSDEQAYIVGWSNSGSLGGSRRKNNKEGGYDAFVAEIDDDGDLDWLRFIGGDEDDWGNDIALADDSEPVIIGTTESDTDDDFPITPGAVQSLYSGGASDAFVARVRSNGSANRYVTYLGGSDIDLGLGIAVDEDDDVYAVGQTYSANFSGAGMPDVHDNALSGLSDGFLVKLRTTTIDPLLFSTFIGGNGEESANAVAIDSRLRSHVVGTTTSAASSFPETVDAAQSTRKGSQDAFLAIYDANAANLVYATYHGGNDIEEGLSVAVDKYDDTYIAGVTTSTSNFPIASFQGTYGGGLSDGFVAKYGIKADLELTKTVSDENPLVGDEVTYTLTVKNNGPDDVIIFTVTDALPAGVVFVSAAGDCDEDDDVVTCDGGFLESGDDVSFTITVEVRASVAIENCATLWHPYTDVALSNNSSCQALVPQEQVSFWQNANQEAGTVTALAYTTEVPPLKTGAAAGTIFAGTDGGGVYRSTDGGDNWFPTAVVKTGKDRFVRALAVDGSDGDVFVALYGEGIWYDDDLFDNYTIRNGSGSDKVDKDVLSMAINNYNPDGGGGDGDIFVGTQGKGLFKSKNDGQSWKEFNGTGGTALTNLIVRSITFIPCGGPCLNGDRIFVGTHGGGVYRARTNDGADIWEQINSGLGNLIVHALHYDESEDELYAGTNKGIFKSANPKAATPTWSLETIFDPGFYLEQPVVRSFTETKDGDLFAGTDGAYVFRKELGGSGEWEWPGVASIYPPFHTQHNIGWQSKTVLSLLTAPDDLGGLDVLFGGTQDKGVHRSADNGNNWAQVSNETLNAVIQSMVFLPNGDQLYAGTFGFGVLMSDDFNWHPIVNWTKVNKGLENQWVYAMAALKKNSLNYIYAGTWNGGVFRSTDDGENWHFSGLPHRIVYDLDVNEDNVLYAATDRGEVARSVDQGLTWQEIGVATTAIWALGLDPDDRNILYAGTFGAGVYKSTDGGFTWVKSGMVEGHVFDFAFGENPETNDDGIFAATATGVKFSDDGGATWSDFSTGLTVKDTRTIAVHPDDDDVLIAGTWGGGVFTYDEDSHSWIRDGLPQMPVTAFAINPVNGEVFVGTQSGDLFRRQFNRSSVGSDTPEEIPSAIVLGKNYPNPFNPATTIQFALPEAQDVRLAVYDALGREIRVLVNGVVSAGTHEISFEAANLSSGIYFYRLDANGRSLSQTMILMK